MRVIDCLLVMLASGEVSEWTRQVEETADRLAKEAVQRLHGNHPLTAQPGRGTLPPGLFDPVLPHHPLPAQPPARAREAAKLATVLASSPPLRSPSTAPHASASLLSAVDAILAEAEAVLKREQLVDEAERQESKQADRRQQLVERKAAAALANDTKRRQHRPTTLQPAQSIPPTALASSPLTIPIQLPVAAMRVQPAQREEIQRMKKAIELRTEQRHRERDEAVKAAMLDRQRRDIIARYEEAEGKRREEERKEQEHELLKTQQQERQAEEQQRQQEERHREEEGKRQQLRQGLEDKKRQVAEAIRHQRLLAKQQQQHHLLTQHTQTLQRRTDKRVLQHAWQQWLTAVVQARRLKQSKAASVWRFNCAVRYFRLWKSVARQMKAEKREVGEERMRRRKEDRRVQAAAHWKLQSTQRSATASIRQLSISHDESIVPLTSRLCVCAVSTGSSLRGDGAYK